MVKDKDPLLKDGFSPYKWPAPVIQQPNHLKEYVQLLGIFDAVIQEVAVVEASAFSFSSVTYLRQSSITRVSVLTVAIKPSISSFLLRSSGLDPTARSITPMMLLSAPFAV